MNKILSRARIAALSAILLTGCAASPGGSDAEHDAEIAELYTTVATAKAKARAEQIAIVAHAEKVAKARNEMEARVNEARAIVEAARAKVSEAAALVEAARAKVEVRIAEARAEAKATAEARVTEAKAKLQEALAIKEQAKARVYVAEAELVKRVTELSTGALPTSVVN